MPAKPTFRKLLANIFAAFELLILRKRVILSAVRNRIFLYNFYLASAESLREEELSNKTKKPRNTLLTKACKQFLIRKPPEILTLHLKRFQQTGHNLRKINKHIEFPLVLDLAPFCHKDTLVSIPLYKVSSLRVQPILRWLLKFYFVILNI